MENITVIGIGKLGLGFALLLEQSGYNVLGIDIFPDYVKSLNNKTYQCLEPSYNELIQNAVHFRASTDLQEGLDFSSILFIIVQTPSGGGEKFYDHTILSNLLIKINKLKCANKHIIIGCTTMPGYTDNIAKTLIKDCINCSISFNPEFVAQGSIIQDFKHPDIILVGTDNDALRPILKDIYDKMSINTPVYCFLKPTEAEITKICLNSYITTKISFANMISDLCDTLGADKEVVLKSVGSDSRVGNKYFSAGYSFGGPCFPRDTKALSLLMQQNNIPNDLLIATTKYNQYHVIFQANKLLNDNTNEFIFTNVCYKENSIIPIIEESAKLKIAYYLTQHGKKVTIRDTQEIILETIKEYGNAFTYEIL